MLSWLVHKDVANRLWELRHFLSIDQDLMTSAQAHNIHSIFKNNRLDTGGGLHAAWGIFDVHHVETAKAPTIPDQSVGTGTSKIIVIAVKGMVVAISTDLAHT